VALSRLRVTGGHLAGRRFRAPAAGTRPTSDRVRESLFSRLGDLTGLAVVDLYAGSGALGIEALSRGAASLVCVDRAVPALNCVRANVAELGLVDRVRVRKGEVVGVVRQLGRAGERFDLALVDPPYESQEAYAALSALVEAEVLAPEAMVVLERGRRHPSPEVAGLIPLDERRYGDTVVARFVKSGPGDPEDREP
jgi:16S rRNA (guanine966-N2)-methyltransferase